MPPTNAPALSWDAFPEPPPEAATWKPNPAYIASPGQLKDPRFNKDPGEAARRNAGRMSSASPLLNESGIKDLNAGKWPPQVRRYGEPERSPAVSASGISSPKPVNAEVGGPRKHMMHAAVKDTTESLAVKPLNSYTSTTSPERVAPPKSASPTKKPMPAWAGPLERALAEDTPKGPIQSTQTEVKSLPPHLRKTDKSINASAGPGANHKLDPVATSYDLAGLDLNARFEAACAATRRVSGSEKVLRSTGNDTGLIQGEALAPKMATPYNGLKEVNQGAIREDMPTDANKQHLTSAADDGKYKNRQHFLKVSLIIAMQKDVWEHELLQLSEEDLEERMFSISSEHEKVWQAKHGRGSHTQNGVGNNIHGK